METWYNVNFWSTQPSYKAVDVARHNEKSVWLGENGRKRARNAYYEKFLPTEQAAQEACVAHLQWHQQATERDIEAAERKLKLIQELLAQDPATYRRD